MRGTEYEQNRGAGVHHPRRRRPGGGGPDEDREGGFAHGGWQMAYNERMDTLGEGDRIVEEWESKT